MFTAQVRERGLTGHLVGKCTGAWLASGTVPIAPAMVSNPSQAALRLFVEGSVLGALSQNAQNAAHLDLPAARPLQAALMRSEGVQGKARLRGTVFENQRSSLTDQ